MPYLTSNQSGIGGRLKVEPEDFFVEEIPLYPPCGQGQHVYLEIEKRGLSSNAAKRKIAHALNVSPHAIGYAGLKDTHAVTRQIISIEHVEPRIISELDLPRISVLWVNRHGNKLKLGHLAGNRFQIKLRNTDPDAADKATQCLNVLQERGVPNYFGSQRFGVRCDSWIMGAAIIKQDAKAMLDQFCGRAISADKDVVRKARDAFDRGQYELSAELWPPYFRDARRACRILAGPKPSHERAVAAIDHKLKRLFVSAYQSYLFNNVLARRIDTLDRLFVGDLACKHVNGAVFTVVDDKAEQARADQFEISPTGPLFGYRMTFPNGQEGLIEKEILQENNLTLDEFRAPKAHKVKGSRRPLRVQMHDLSVETGSDDLGGFLSLRFELPSGSYATAVLKELMKDNIVETREPMGEGDT